MGQSRMNFPDNYEQHSLSPSSYTQDKQCPAAEEYNKHLLVWIEFKSTVSDSLQMTLPIPSL